MNRYRDLWNWVCALCVIVGSTSTALASDSLAILPGELTLTGPHAKHRLVVEQVRDGQFIGQAAGEVLLKSGDEAVVRIEDGIAVAAGNGKTTITAAVGGQKASIPVTVVQYDVEHEWSFRNHVQSILAKYGCNSGACHGALAGKGGFKLSLQGYDTNRDYFTITKQARSRRVELADPARSLILTKPTGAVPHKGGVRFGVDSHEYEVLADWLAAGAPPPTESDARLQRLEILPEQAVLEKDATQQLIVRAHFTDGHVEDVTHWAKYTATNESVARVTQDGGVTLTGHGEGAVTAWYASQIVIARITAPYPNELPPETFAQAPRRNFIDELVLEKLQSLNLPPSGQATDQEFIRRVFLDAIGHLPTAKEVREFLADTSPDKRDRLLDDLLARPEFVDYWAYKWSDLLLVSGERLRPKAVQAYYQWIRDSVAANKPWDQFVWEIVTAKGSSYENGATNFYALHQDPQEMSETTSVAFLGLSINCARCHNHPLEKWTNDQYYSMANLFARVRAKGWGGDFRGGDGLRTLYVADEGELIQPLTGKAQPPMPLDGEPIPFDDPTDRRVHLARWLTSPENPYFARAITNRVWANFFGVGLVEPVDDLRQSNPASNEELLTVAADYLIQNKFDLKMLIRAIVQSATYQRSSAPLPLNKDEERFYSRYYPKRLMAEVMLDAISQVTEVPTTFAGYDKGTRALQLPDSSVDSGFLKTFGRPERVITCECERTTEPSIVQVLHISNGDTINEKLQAKEGRVSAIVASGASDEEVVEEAFLASLSRYPTETEKQQLVKMIAEAKDERRIAIEDLYWGLLSSREFLFNH